MKRPLQSILYSNWLTLETKLIDRHSLVSDFSKMMTKPISSNSKNKTTYSIDRLDRRGIYLSQGHNVK